MRRMGGLKTVLSMICLAGMVAAGSATAATYGLNVGNSDLTSAGYMGPYGTVDVTLTDSKHAIITLTADTSTYNYLFGDGGSIGLSVNATKVDWDPLSITWTGGNNSGPGVRTGFNLGGSRNVSEFGDFNFTLINNDGFKCAVSGLSFTLIYGDTGSGWADAASVLTSNDKGYFVEAHVFPPNGLETGFAANGTPSVPDGASTVALLGLALLGIGSLRNRFKKN